MKSMLEVLCLSSIALAWAMLSNFVRVTVTEWGQLFRSSMIRMPSFQEAIELKAWKNEKYEQTLISTDSIVQAFISHACTANTSDQLFHLKFDQTLPNSYTPAQSVSEFRYIRLDLRNLRIRQSRLEETLQLEHELLDHGNELFNPSFSTIRNVRLSLTLKVGTYGNEDGALPNIIGMSVSDLTNAVEKFHWLAILTMLLLSQTYYGPVCNVTPGC
ncbi:hypothetical protein EDB19DRAFT_1826418 [Suillus lakei]|nr:hypothetical protein EDB19DRAFT_1826418 [Suillus lakei]